MTKPKNKQQQVRSGAKPAHQKHALAGSDSDVQDGVNDLHISNSKHPDAALSTTATTSVNKLPFTPSPGAATTLDKLHTVFAKEAPEAIARRKQEARAPLHHINSPLYSTDWYSDNSIPIPIRPPWHSKMSTEELERNELKAYNEWLTGIYSKYKAEELNHFEHNLEVWRQLWRVCRTFAIAAGHRRCPQPAVQHPAVISALHHADPAQADGARTQQE